MADQEIIEQSRVPAFSDPSAGGAMANAETRRAIAEVQSAMLIAKQFPRNRTQALDQIMRECGRQRLAEDALYSFSRGGQEITGPSIRLAEVLAQNWGNLEFGWNEVARSQGVSEVIAFAWDTQTNVRLSMKFHVRHVRDTKSGAKPLRDERDIYEVCANQAARRMRACILNIIPGDIIDEAVEICEATLAKKETITPDSIKKMVDSFAAFGVPKEKLERRCQRKIETITSPQMIQLRRIYNSVKDGMSTVDEWFDQPERPTRDAPAAEAVEEQEDPFEIQNGAGEVSKFSKAKAADTAFRALIEAAPSYDALVALLESNTLSAQLRDRGFADLAEGLAKFSEAELARHDKARRDARDAEAAKTPAAEATKTAESENPAPQAEKSTEPAKEAWKPSPAPKSPMSGKDKGDWPTWARWFVETIRAMPKDQLDGFMKANAREYDFIVHNRSGDADAIAAALDERRA